MWSCVMNTRTFEGKVAFVTGATSGIGQSVAVAFGQEGAAVIGCGRNAAGGAKTERLVEAAGGSFQFVPLDLCDETEIVAAMRIVMDRHGRLDCAANCAGFDLNAPFLDYTAADFDMIFGTNVRGLFLCMQHEVKAMRLMGGGTIVNVGSIAGDRPIRGNSLYNASKSALNMLTQTAALECGTFGVRINVVAPGPVMTPMLRGFIEKSQKTETPFSEESLIAASPLSRIAKPEEIATSVLFLCSPQAANITGAVLTVDGGFALAY
jgi:NAD(P)-dependent dehydrogenase (short-subunit alcohol dehydrogenase family)